MSTSSTPPDIAKLIAELAELPGRIAESMQSVAGVPPLLVDIHGVAKATSLSRATIYRLVSSGEFPAPVQCPAGTRWTMKSISDWVNRLKSR